MRQIGLPHRLCTFSRNAAGRQNRLCSTHGQQIVQQRFRLGQLIRAIGGPRLRPDGHLPNSRQIELRFAVQRNGLFAHNRRTIQGNARGARINNAQYCALRLMRALPH